MIAKLTEVLYNLSNQPPGSPDAAEAAADAARHAGLNGKRRKTSNKNTIKTRRYL
ncbi:MAG: hypothetical protein IKD96_05575 [Oscillospiraceae bacterium]|nr:hypothetical protein [Oscillospiraceae bacterium]